MSHHEMDILVLPSDELLLKFFCSIHDDLRYCSDCDQRRVTMAPLDALVYVFNELRVVGDG
jgi:hypothetical protein